MAEIPGTNIDSVLQEQRKFECPENFRKDAHIKSLEEYERIYKESVEQPEKFWGQDRRRTALVQEVGQSPGVEAAHGRNGSSAASSIFPTTASTAMFKPGAKTKPPSSGKASRARCAPSLTSNCTGRSRSSPTSSRSCGIDEGRPRSHLHAA